ncbi:EVE domain-containing protein [Mahella australiensis]|uniref:EVE domain-containing protein n=1 Tax=Mahella australiensis TaxID=252966 RepID=UPI001C0A8930|nr:EVE domain-containing protein [Mahella australiensis]
MQGEIGYDGIWKSPSGLYIVIEVKTSDVYTIHTSTLIGYIDKLISEHVIPDWDHALGLYVIGRNDYGIKQLENTIIAEKRTDKLRIITVDKLLSLAELLADYEMAHEAVLTVLQPMGPTIDSLVELISSLVAQEIDVEVQSPDEGDEPNPEPPENDNTKYYLALGASHDDQSADKWIEKLLDAKVYATSERSSLRRIKQGDGVCFYAAGKGIIAHAQVKSPPAKGTHPLIGPSDKYPYIIELESINIYTENPVVLDADLREQLDAFQGRDPSKKWSWFVQSTREITKHDFMLLTRQ